MEESEYVPVASSAEVDGPPHPRVEVDGATLLLVRLPDGAVVAVDAACPHLGNPLTRAELDGRVLECPFHFYAYELPSGRNCFPGDEDDLRLGVHPTREADGTVFVARSALGGGP